MRKYGAIEGEFLARVMVVLENIIVCLVENCFDRSLGHRIISSQLLPGPCLQVLDSGMFLKRLTPGICEEQCIPINKYS